VVTRSGAGMRAIVWAAMAAWIFGATGAGAASVSEVRVGTHEDGHTRIVVELDSPAGYRLQSPQPGARPELVVDLDATSIQRDVPSKSRVVKKVRVEPSDAGSTVHISLATGDVAVKEMLLANPPRIVLDLKARGPIPKGDADAVAAADAPAPASDEPKPTASAAPIAVAPPTPAKAEVPKSEPVVVAAAEPAAAVEKSEASAPRETSPRTTLTLPSAAAPSEAKRDLMPPPPTDPQPDLEPTASDEPAAKPTLIPPIERAKSAEPQATEPTKPSLAQTAEERRKAITAKAPQATPSSESLVDLAMSPIGLAVIGGVVLLLAVVVIRRRRAAEDDDPLYTVMSADDAGAGVSMDAAYPADAAKERPPVLAALGPYESDGFDEASEPAVRVGPSGPRQLALGRVSEASDAVAAQEPSAASMLTDDPDSIFGGEPEVVATQMSPVVSPAHDSSPVAAQVGQISAEVERRVAELERRLEQLTEARERLERQVAAQTEELRVQRAAIARTQRVVRTIAKTEDMATEPVPRAPTA
jgi:hypothetical protein